MRSLSETSWDFTAGLCIGCAYRKPAVKHGSGDPTAVLKFEPVDWGLEESLWSEESKSARPLPAQLLQNPSGTLTMETLHKYHVKGILLAPERDMRVSPSDSSRLNLGHPPLGAPSPSEGPEQRGCGQCLPAVSTLGQRAGETLSLSERVRAGPGTRVTKADPGVSQRLEVATGGDRWHKSPLASRGCQSCRQLGSACVALL